MCNQTSDIEETGGLNDPNTPNKKLTKLESFLYLIENDSTISENKKNLIKNPQPLSNSTDEPKLNKKKSKSIKRKGMYLMFIGKLIYFFNLLILIHIYSWYHSK